MSLDSVKKLFSKETISDVFDFTKSQIKSAAAQQLDGQQKKNAVVKTVVEKLMVMIKAVDFPGNDDIWDSSIEAVLNVIVPVLVQKIYDLLKAPSENI